MGEEQFTAPPADRLSHPGNRKSKLSSSHGATIGGPWAISNTAIGEIPGGGRGPKILIRVSVVWINLSNVGAEERATDDGGGRALRKKIALRLRLLCC